MFRSILTPIVRHWAILVVTLIVNLAIPWPSVAGIKDDVCWDPDLGEQVECCTSCVFFCGCSLDDLGTWP
jgi:hypothetical protein